MADILRCTDYIRTITSVIHAPKNAKWEMEKDKMMPYKLFWIIFWINHAVKEKFFIHATILGLALQGMIFFDILPFPSGIHDEK